jgi:hypothetical protein
MKKWWRVNKFITSTKLPFIHFCHLFKWYTCFIAYILLHSVSKYTALIHICLVLLIFLLDCYIISGISMSARPKGQI